MDTILNSKFSKPFNTAPFSEIKNEDFLPAFIKEIDKAHKEIEEITHNSATPSYENTIEALEFVGEQLSRIHSIFFNLNNAETNPEIQKIAQQVSPIMSDYENDINLNQDLFKRIKSVYLQKDNLKLSIEQQTLLDKKYKSFVRNGANLNSEEKERLRAIDKQLSQLKLKFGENVLAETNKFELHVTDKDQLKGLPDDVINSAALAAKQKDKSGYIFTLAYPSYLPFMTYAKNRALREKMFKAFNSKGFHKDELDNQSNIQQIVALRYERAQLLGYESHAHYVLEERMAENPKTVMSFLEDLLKKAKPAAEKEFKQLGDFAKKLDGIQKLQKWDAAYYKEKLKQQLFNLDDEKLKPYFKLENVISGVFTIAKRLYNLSFEEIDTIDKYHEDVKTYKVTGENNELVAIFYADFHPRPGKRNGAWMTSYKTQSIKDGVNERPHISIVCNFTKPTDNKPSLLTFNEVTTLFHEFGHALHGILANTVYPSLSGTNVYWDFVELPSQIMENWCYEKEALEIFARHYETDEVLPMHFITKIKESATFMEGMQTLRQISFGLLDMKWHSEDPKNIKDVKKLEDAVFKNITFYPATSETCMSTAFSHIFQGGYSSGYYSYKWAEVLDADAFELFKEKGIFDNNTAKSFKDHVLSKGGIEAPMKLYKKFRGQEPQSDALLRRAGLLTK
ncbi:M3 family metallopeptidase [Ascidiimonas sp. W6]|uniref:M3 family metallopeptidase n=1 Tax=Ascidiimonas meishanensis TaxID=3128903 RepID=UPI0030EF99E9